ncbi:hypothetical protein AQ490_04440 [Wenjunlia vitaminophila]|uniref:DUF7847 domain-containing protein n=1 Tax=Wenjunlia vitaminophila TaxID=76728 RepID=A0A0T6LNI6_WENVI|nr:glycerophosphoryl diester phosphodiesterase membrane domain-containing protein [Wenjunlia vitaminophila]KRV47651.1 hypothetical protein AQ490_04440 [Wenjunlia vitaminophila]
MTDNPGWASPSPSPDDAPDPAAPQTSGSSDTAPDQAGTAGPGGPDESSMSKWSKQQPPRADWTAPGRGPGSGAPSGGTPPPPGWGAGPQPGRPPGWGPGAPGPGGPPGAWGQPGWGAPGQFTPNWGQPPAAKPGVIPLRPLGVGEILDGAVSTMRAHWRTVLGVSLVVAVITQAVSTLITWVMLNGIDDDLDRLQDDPDPSFSETMDVFGGMAAGVGTVQLISLLGTIVVQGTLTMVVSRSVLGRPVTTRDAWDDAKPRLLRLLGFTLLMPLILSGVFVVALLPGLLALLVTSEALAITLFVLGGIAGVCVAVWLWVRFSLAPPALMLERQTVLKAMARSAKLVRGSWWRVFGIMLLTFIIMLVVSSIVQTPFSLASLAVDGESVGSLFSGDGTGELSLGSLTVTGIGAALGMTLTFPISAGVTALLYIDQRIRREALDLELGRAANLPGYGGTGPTQPPSDAPVPGDLTR